MPKINVPGADTAIGLWWLNQATQSIESAAHELSTALGVPLCVENCGLCCAVNTPSAYAIEVTKAAGWLTAQPKLTRESILDSIEDWLIRPVLDVYRPDDPHRTVQFPTMGKKNIPINFETEIAACLRGRCPLLGADLRCRVYEVRPLICRTYGVTKSSDWFCLRPNGIGESSEYRAVHEDEGTQAFRVILEGFRLEIAENPKLGGWALFPTALYGRFREKKLLELLPQIPAARLIGNSDTWSAPMGFTDNPQESQGIRNAIRAHLDRGDGERPKVTVSA